MTIFQPNFFLKQKCHHGDPLGAEGPGQLLTLPLPLNLAVDPRARSKFGAPMFEPDVFRKQMYFFEEVCQL